MISPETKSWSPRRPAIRLSYAATMGDDAEKLQHPDCGLHNLRNGMGTICRRSGSYQADEVLPAL